MNVSLRGRENGLANTQITLALISLILGEYFLFTRKEPWFSWFYPVMWWSYIFLIDGIIFRLQGNSLILSRTREFVIMIPCSVSFWLLFELINLRLENWHYINVVENLYLRWVGYFISFGTVLPGIFSTYDLLNCLKILPPAKSRPLSIPTRYFPLFYFLGTTFFLLPLIFPKYFFPLVWLALILLLEPINYHHEAPSLLRNFAKGNFRPLTLLLAAGLICGFLWEFWNFWAKCKWVYTLPFFQQFKIFEMPLAGFLGFPPFAVGAFAFYSFTSLFCSKINRHLKSQNKKIPIFLGAILIISLLIFWALSFHYIDLYTVKSFSFQ